MTNRLQNETAGHERLSEAETAAKVVVKNYRTLAKMFIEYDKFRKKFVEVAKEFTFEFLTVRDYFAHKPTDELFLGKYRDGEEWSQGELGITYRHFCRCTPRLPAAPPLLPEKAETASKTEKEPQTPTVSDFTAVLTELSTKLSELNALTKEIKNDAENGELDIPSLEQVHVLITSLRKISKDASERADRLESVVADRVAA